MSREEILEESQNVFEADKEYKFQIKEVGEAVPTTKSFYRKWTFSTFIDGNAHDIAMNLFPFQMIPLLELMGCKKENGKLKVDYDKIEGVSIYAKVFVEKYKYTKEGVEKEGSSNKLKDFRFDESDAIPF